MANGHDPKPRPLQGVRPGAGTDKTLEEELGLEGTIMSRVLGRLIDDITNLGREAAAHSEKDVLGQFLRDLAFIPGPESASVQSDSPAAQAMAREMGVSPNELRLRSRTPLFNEATRNGLINLASIFSRPPARDPMQRGTEAADATAVARGRLLERVAAQQALDELLKPKPLVAEQ